LRHPDPDSDALLRTYSQLFLAPPTPASLNAGMYLDGGIMGNSVLEMDALYQRYALARDAEFRDLPDHLALQLQFLGYLMALSAESDTPDEVLNDAHGFIRNHLLNWLPVLTRQCQCAEARYALPPVYSSLAAVTIEALNSLRHALPEPAAGDVETPPRAIPDNPVPRPVADSGDQATCSRCNKPFMAGSELAAMITALQSHGLDAGHLAVCADCRTSAMGLQPLTPPRPKKPGRD
jgi:putative dimethyl sulfoxide reductase chaperone